MTLTISDKLKYFESIRVDNERILWAVLSIIGRPDGFIHIGCGDGWVVRSAFASAIKPSIGIESDAEICSVSSLGAKILCRQLDRPFKVGGYFGLVMALTATKLSNIDLHQLGLNLLAHTDRWLVIAKPWPDIIIHSLVYKPELSARLACAISDDLGIFEKVRNS